MKCVRTSVAVVIALAILVCVSSRTRAAAGPADPTFVVQVGRAILCWPAGLAGDDQATELAAVANEVFGRVGSVLGVNSDCVGNVQIMCEAVTDISRAGWVGGNRAGIVLYLQPGEWPDCYSYPEVRHALALEYSRVVLLRTSSGEYGPNAAFFDGIANAAADLAYPGYAAFPFRHPHLVCAGLLMLDCLSLPTLRQPWFYVFLVGESFCRFLAEEHGGQVLVELDRALRLASDADRAFMDVFGNSLDELERDWRSMLATFASSEPDRASSLGRAVHDLGRLVRPLSQSADSLALAIDLHLRPDMLRQTGERLREVHNALYNLDPYVLRRAQAEYESVLDKHVHALRAWRDCAQELLMEVIWPVESGAGRKEAVTESIDRVRRTALEMGAQDIIDLCDQYLQSASFLQP